MLFKVCDEKSLLSKLGELVQADDGFYMAIVIQ
jgi:hypothetical protein